MKSSTLLCVLFLAPFVLSLISDTAAAVTASVGMESLSEELPKPRLLFDDLANILIGTTEYPFLNPEFLFDPSNTEGTESAETPYNPASDKEDLGFTRFVVHHDYGIQGGSPLFNSDPLFCLDSDGRPCWLWDKERPSVTDLRFHELIVNYEKYLEDGEETELNSAPK